MSTLGLLSYEIISLIATHVTDHDLYESSLINRAFHQAANPLLWRYIFIPSPDFLDTLLRGMMASQPFFPLGQYVRKIQVVCYMNDDLLMKLLPHVPHLEEIYFPFENGVSDSSLAYLAHQCPRLKRLDLYTSHALTLRSVAHLGQQCQHLTHLSFRDCQDVPATILSPLTMTTTTTAMQEEACPPPLVSLCTDGYWMNVAQSVMDLTRFSRLTQLMIDDAPAECITAIVSLGTGCWPALKTLSLASCAGVHDAHLIPFIQTHPALTNIALEGARFTNHTLVAMADCLSTTITMLDVPHTTKITAQGIHGLIRRCPRLIFVSVYECRLLKSDFPEDDDDDNDDDDDDDNGAYDNDDDNGAYDNDNDIDNDNDNDNDDDDDGHFNDHFDDADLQAKYLKVLKESLIHKIRRTPPPPPPPAPPLAYTTNNDINQG
ncbi:hypothetical protein BCR42DRAFT_426401 [Absidia repens]|uniref:F-box domain-containing protein n=1 Tax=Absidia repens TaxID=90262 RepID=A0A1X2I132_9FUNG|nr:hypothetical protein BCR42DRAFT_426401 [Absidia repens]